MNEKRIYKNILNLLIQLESISNGEVLTSISTPNPSLRIWRHTILFPADKPENLYIVLPDDNQDINFDKEISQTRHYIIDCFERFKTSPNVVTPNDFFSRFIFRAGKYKSFVADSNESRDIERLYTARTISFFNNEESNVFDQIPNRGLEELLDEWLSKGSRPILLLGERGMGKTWSARRFCLRNYKLHNRSPWTRPLPIYVNLRLLSEDIPGVTNISELLFYHLKKLYKIRIFGDYAMFAALLISHRIVLVIDGLDEMSKEVSKEITLKNLWQIFSLFSSSSKFILTSRKNFFSSKMQIYEHFAFENLYLKRRKREDCESSYKIEERKIRQNFNIWELEPFDYKTRTALLDKARNLHDKTIEKGLDKLEKLQQKPQNTIEKELFNLWEIPSYFLPIVRLLASNQVPSKIELFEQCIDSVIIEFNIEMERAIDKYRTIDNTTNSITGHLFDVDQKNEILRKLSWYMVERGIREFDIVEFPKFIRDIEGNDYDIIISDLQTQTVITLKEDGKYSFVNESLFGFYVANFLFLSLTSDDIDVALNGIQSLGKYSLDANDILLKARIFLSAKIDLLKKSATGKSSLERIKILSERTFISDRPYSPWLKHLSNNLRSVGIGITSELLNEYDHWNLNPISDENNKTDKKMVLIPGNNVEGKNRVDPFFLSMTEVTNRDYYEFLESNEFDGGKKIEDCLGHYWKRTEAFGKNRKSDNPYLKIINYYRKLPLKVHS